MVEDSAASAGAVVSRVVVREEGSNMARMSVNDFAQQIGASLGERLVSLLLYGSAVRDTGRGGASMNTLLIVDAVDVDLLGRLSVPVREWVRARHPPPLVLAEREWRDSTDVFPIEYEDIRAHHRLLAGRDPWPGLRVEHADVRRQLEQELMGKLIHLRQAYAAEWGSPKRLAELVGGTRAGFLTMLRAVLRLAGHATPASSEALVRDAAALIGFSSTGLTEPAAYLDAVTRTAGYVNRMERNPS